MSVDGTDCPIQEPTPFSSQWFSHKLNGAGFRYEVGVGTGSAGIVWIRGPYACGSHPDLRIYRESLKGMLQQDELVIADEGYKDASVFSAKDAAEDGMLDYHRAIRARHEIVNGRLKRWKVLTVQFRHQRDLHGMCFFAVANLTQLILRIEAPLFEVS